MGNRFAGMAALLLIAAMAGLALLAGLSPATPPATAASPADSAHLGVASCSGSTCHGRQEADGKIVRQDELMRWQEPSSAGGAHSRAFNVLTNARSAQIANRLGIGSATSAPMCLGCHSAPASQRGPRFQASDGVGCETCHGGATGWLASHYAVGASHQRNISQGMIALDQPKARAAVCLDCHFGSADEGQFVNHRIMAAGHPRISFELDLFSTLQQHHDEDADYQARKGKTNNVRFWAVGQAMALERALSLYQNSKRGQEGIFPEFYFFDCHTCHRRIYDGENAVSTVVRNPARPIPEGMPAFNDENMIMLSAAAHVAAPGLARQFDADSRAFHMSLGIDRAASVAAAGRLRTTANALATAFNDTAFTRAQTFAIIESIASEAITPRFTDYEGSVQSVMAVDTLLNALVNAGQISTGAAGGIRANINTAYEAVNDPNDYRPLEFRRALGSAVRTIRTLK
ncbi:multiheme c-type cytochrome [Sphingobium boeckii]|uniref:Cytochrome c-552/4 domain-containing protein n=1 Tax=Sphingobium boeckii TaxID=1082345 RepID=A0A7W9AHL8_9SPHN|nr:multiheme c-type cytochrome [Sphingobium boeckii]MBB5685853.1 hypothetical protein [Sphingobium boeckii]